MGLEDEQVNQDLEGGSSEWRDRGGRVSYGMEKFI